MKKLLYSLFIATTFTAGATINTPIAPHNMQKAIPEKQIQGRSIKLLEPQSGDLKADFTRRGETDEQTFWSENFDNGLDAWTVEPTKEVTWQLKNASTPFSSISPGDTQSLYTDVPYQVFKREKSWVTSPQITIPQNAMLRCWLYFTLNWKDVCALEIHISTDDFNTSERLYTSLDEEGEKQAQWRHIGVSLSKYAGKDVKIRFMYTYGTDDETFQTGGYQGDFYIDGIEITGAIPTTSIEAQTGEEINFIDLSEGNPTQWLWTMPGAVPETSTEQNPVVYYTQDGKYDVTLQVTDKNGNTAAITKPGLVNITGTAPVAHILPPATFRYATTRKHMIAPATKVKFRDASEGFPTQWNWSISGVKEDSKELLNADTQEVDVNYFFQHDWSADLTVSNQHGESSDHADVSVEYYGAVNNLLPEDNLTTFDLEGRGTFPGSNSMNITAYAEKFSAPSVPSIIEGATVYFTKNTTEELIDQIQNVGVHLYTCEDGKPGKKIDSMWWSVFELEISQTPGSLLGTNFEFTTRPVVKDEFFIVVDGIPNIQYGADVAFAMADFRAEHGTAWMEKDGKWIEVSSYFPAGKNHTSFAIYPYITHSVITPYPLGTEATVEVPANASTTDFEFYSIMGWQSATSDSDWCRVINEPSGITLDKLTIECDEKPETIDTRTAQLTITDGVSEMIVTVHQSGINNISNIDNDTLSTHFDGSQLHITTTDNASVNIYDTAGQLMYKNTIYPGDTTINLGNLTSGMYILSINTPHNQYRNKIVKR